MNITNLEKFNNLLKDIKEHTPSYMIDKNMIMNAEDMNQLNIIFQNGSYSENEIFNIVDFLLNYWFYWHQEKDFFDKSSLIQPYIPYSWKWYLTGILDNEMPWLYIPVLKIHWDYSMSLNNELIVKKTDNWFSANWCYSEYWTIKDINVLKTGISWKNFLWFINELENSDTKY